MNHFSYEIMGKEKLKGLQEEGMLSQASQGSGMKKLRLLRSFPKLIFLLLVVLGLLNLLWH